MTQIRIYRGNKDITVFVKIKSLPQSGMAFVQNQNIER